MMLRSAVLAIFAALILLCSGVAALASGSVSSSHSVGVSSQSVVYSVTPSATTSKTSHNWAGYAVSSSNHTVTFVTGSWIVPAIHGTCGSKTTWSSFWVGIDGYTGTTVEQTGTSSLCSGGTAFYKAWYEFYPASSITLSMTISPGDSITASVSFSSTGNVWSTTLKDTTNGNSGGNSHNQKGLARNSAEWIAEDPSKISGGQYPLADFGTASFTNCKATISGSTHSISGFSNFKITMWNIAGTATKAVPKSLSSGGKNFSVTWKSAGP